MKRHQREEIIAIITAAAITTIAVVKIPITASTL